MRVRVRVSVFVRSLVRASVRVSPIRARSDECVRLSARLSFSFAGLALCVRLCAAAAAHSKPCVPLGDRYSSAGCCACGRALARSLHRIECDSMTECRRCAAQLQRTEDGRTRLRRIGSSSLCRRLHPFGRNCLHGTYVCAEFDSSLVR